MKRQDKYPETKTFHYYNANPKNRITGDCVARALCTALEIPYNQCVIEQAQVQCETGFDAADTKGIEKYLERKGWKKHEQPKKYDGTKYTVKEFCENIAEAGKRYVVNMANHTVAIVDRKAWDIWDCTNPFYTKCVGNYWSL